MNDRAQAAAKVGLAFSEAEHRTRIARARKAIRAAGFEVCVVMAPEHLYYFAGYDAHTHFSIQAFVFGTGDDDPLLIIRDVDRACADETAWVKNIRVYRHPTDDPAALIAKAVSERAKPGSKVGVCINTFAVRGAFALHLMKTLAPFTVTEATPTIQPLRYVKSPQELAYVRTAAAYADAGLKRAYEAARPGVTEIQLTGAIEAAMRDAGSEYCAMPAWVSSGPRTPGSHRTPTHRAIEKGDVIKLEFGGVHRRYHAVTMQTFWVGKAPDSQGREAYTLAVEALRAGSRAIKAGAVIGDSERAAFAVMKAAGYGLERHARFGYGVGIAYPPTWLEGLDITSERTERFAAGMTFVLHTQVYTPTEGMMPGGAYAITEKGLEVWSGGDLELLVV